MTNTVENKRLIIKNINGTSQKICKCGSWLQHWHNYSKQSTSVCCVKGCLNQEISGVHIQKNLYEDTSWYIVPLCNEHRNSKGLIELANGVRLVSAHKSLTCG